ncbi:hypothetical protein SAMN06297251_101255 [Fulvimarina manganoxydans]|uniref:Uncharacterized protein n=1 Tax=Fulvimarina manganoxydans TaxID=937218 RepID=A0A1W1YFR2_9HYPH|nr:hypothetical protein [Fulvimarina manganoxydans]SMC34966.1 hypothetical protein SAMN06297251_101255 [Fulvimarina manganoxydans]
MTDEVGNLVLEQLRIMRGEINDLRSEMNSRFDVVNERLDSLENAVSGIAYFLAETRGGLISHDARIAKLEQA